MSELGAAGIIETINELPNDVPDPDSLKRVAADDRNSVQRLWQ